MGFFNALMGNASEVDSQSLQREFGPLLCPGETIEKGFKLFRDKWVFTNKRLIVQDAQGMTGKKREYLSVPYHAVERFSVETAGTMDLDSDLKIWVKGCAEPLMQKIKSGDDIFEIQRVLAAHVL